MQALVRVRRGPLLYSHVHLLFLSLIIVVLLHSKATLSFLFRRGRLQPPPRHDVLCHFPQPSRFWKEEVISDDGRSSSSSRDHHNDNDDVSPAAGRPVLPQNISLHIVYEDNDILAINKPAGVAVQFSAGSVERAVTFYLNATTTHSSSSNGRYYYGTLSWPWKSPCSFEGIVHRLDKGTSGILLVAKHPDAARTLKLAFEERRVHKTYLAIAEGLPRTLNNTSSSSSSPARGLPATTTTNNNNTTINSWQQEEPQEEEEEPTLYQKHLSKKIKNCGRNHTQALHILMHATNPSASCYSAAISVCRRAGERDLAISLLKSILQPSSSSSSSVQPNLLSFKTVLSLCALDPPLCDTALHLVLHPKMPVKLHPHCVSSAIAACGRGNRLEDALRLLHLIETQQGGGHVYPCRQAAIKACERCGDWNHAQLLRQELLLSTTGRQQQQRHTHDTTNTAASSAAVLGIPIRVDAPIGKIGPRRMGITTTSLNNNGREAQSVVTPLAFRNGKSYNRIVIETGRTHQIRVHMADVLKCPLVGDAMYDPDRQSGKKRRPMLHAAKLVVPHRTTNGMSLCLECPPPPDFEELAVQIMGQKDYYETNFGLLLLHDNTTS